jgi:uncharacterized protein YbcI
MGMEPPTAPAYAQRTDSLGRDLTRAMVRIFKDHFGRGPSIAKIYFNDDLVLCMLQDTMTRAERTLIEDGKADQVRELRDSFRTLFRQQAIPVVEALVGRRVIAFLGDHAVDPDCAIECFVLEPESGSQDSSRKDDRLPQKPRT